MVLNSFQQIPILHFNFNFLFADINSEILRLRISFQPHRNYILIFSWAFVWVIQRSEIWYFFFEERQNIFCISVIWLRDWVKWPRFPLPPPTRHQSPFRAIFICTYYSSFNVTEVAYSKSPSIVNCKLHLHIFFFTTTQTAVNKHRTDSRQSEIEVFRASRQGDVNGLFPALSRSWIAKGVIYYRLLVKCNSSSLCFITCLWRLWAQKVHRPLIKMALYQLHEWKLAVHKNDTTSKSIADARERIRSESLSLLLLLARKVVVIFLPRRELERPIKFNEEIMKYNFFMIAEVLQWNELSSKRIRKM